MYKLQKDSRKDIMFENKIYLNSQFNSMMLSTLNLNGIRFYIFGIIKMVYKTFNLKPEFRGLNEL